MIVPIAITCRTSQHHIIHTVLCIIIPSSTLNDGQEDDNHKEEEGDVEGKSEHLIWVSSSRRQHVPNPSPCPQTLVYVVDETLAGKRRKVCVESLSVFISPEVVLVGS